MKKIQKNYNLSLEEAFLLNHFPENALFLDIETTGFSRARSSLYLIGAAWRRNRELILEQFFAEEKADESSLLAALSKLLSQFQTIFTYNGTGFDIPFLESCQKRLDKATGQKTALPDNLFPPNLTFTDLYQTAMHYKHILPLENLKQTTLENYFGFTRDNSYTGGELIDVYKAYLKQPQEELFDLLVLHNEEDLVGMLHLLPLFSYEAFFQGNFTVEKAESSSYRKPDGDTGRELLILCKLEAPLPAPVSCSGKLFFLHAQGKNAAFRIQIFEGELKYFYPDYKNYYYLPEEDLAIHKSLAAYVDKAHRKKARPENCFAKRAGAFLPQSGMPLFTPAFYVEYKGFSYFELSEDFTEDPDKIKAYCLNILKNFKSGIFL